MTFPVQPPVAPMLARLARELPGDGYLYEPKWDGFRCLAFRDGGEVDLRSRHDRRFSRYFPEIVEALQACPRSGSCWTASSSSSATTASTSRRCWRGSIRPRHGWNG